MAVVVVVVVVVVGVAGRTRRKRLFALSWVEGDVELDNIQLRSSD